MSSFISAIFGATLVVFIIRQILSTIRHGKTPRLLGPRSQSIIFGVTKEIANAADAGVVFEHWAEEYGPVYQIPGSLGTKRIVVCDPKAIAHTFAWDSWRYEHNPIAKWELQSMMGVDGLLCTPGEVHKRQRKILSPVFGPSAIRSYTPIFFDSGYKVKNAWDTIMQSSATVETIIDVQEWMNHVALDSVGIAGFSHDFRSLDGHTSTISAIFEELANFKPSHIAKALMLVAQSFPSLLKLPLPRHKLINRLSDNMDIISDNLVEKARVNGGNEKSAIGVLVSAKKTQSRDYMTEAEVRSQMKVLLLAGYETSAASLTWALINLSLNLEKQDKLRAELLPFAGTDPTYEDLANGLPYLDAVVREVIRLHPPLGETTRMALQDDLIPLAQPITTASGAIVNELQITKGTAITVPIHCVNRALSIWGEDGKKFIPERWLLPDGVPQRAKEFPGFQHTLTFLEGPRMCLGKGFALIEIKAVLSVLVRNYIFEARDGPGTKIVLGRRVAFRPRVEGEEGCRVPMRVRRLD